MEEQFLRTNVQETASNKWILAIGKIGFGQKRTSLTQVQNKADSIMFFEVRNGVCIMKPF